MKNGLTKEEVLRRVSANAGMEAAYQGMPGKWQERFLNFCTGKGGLPSTDGEKKRWRSHVSVFS